MLHTWAGFFRLMVNSENLAKFDPLRVDSLFLSSWNEEDFNKINRNSEEFETWTGKFENVCLKDLSLALKIFNSFSMHQHSSQATC